MDWIETKNQLPEINKQFSESDYVLCSQGIGYTPFVGWYNKEKNEWIDAHFKTSNAPVNVVRWMPLPKDLDK